MTVISLPGRTTQPADVAAEVRAQLGRRRVRTNHLPRLIGKSQSYWSRRVNGETPFDTDDLQALADLLGVHPASFWGIDVPDPTPPGVDTRRNNPCYSDSTVILGPWSTAIPQAAAA